jgi:double-strand break repair protein AddB
MFSAGVFALPPGADFPEHLVAGLTERMADQPPEAMARVTLYLNTARMRRRVIDLFTQQGAHFLPRLRLVTDLAQDPDLALPATIPPLRLRLELAKLISGLLDAQPDLAPRAALYDLADSLANLIGEMQSEGVAPQAIAGLDVSNHSKHWERTQTFLSIIAPLFATSLNAEARQRLAVMQLAERWAITPPQDPVLVAGSTASRGTTALFMQAVARLPRGALVLPGYDFDTPTAVWSAMDDALTAEDHPQYRFRHLMNLLAIAPSDIRLWRDIAAPDPDRNRLISLSLRPAPVTDQWLVEGPHLPVLPKAVQGITLLEAQSPRAEALAIALILREAAETGTKAALISPDRNLTRQVTAALDRWSILPDDSAGRPLALSAPGRFLRHVAGLLGEKLTADRLLTLLKHPLTASGARGRHLLFTRHLELKLRKYGPSFPCGEDLMSWAQSRTDDGIQDWAAFLAGALNGLDTVGNRPLADHVAQHRRLAEILARGTAPVGSGGLWDKEAGSEALALMDNLTAESPHGGRFTAAAYRDLFDALVNEGVVREAVQGHPNIMIWGTLEARVQGADLVILGGLNDSVWPKLPEPDPWLNRSMRKNAALLLPERQIGLSAHDYQQAIAAPRVVLTRATRNAEAETVPSRWVNRLMNLMEGLPALDGPAALAQMRARGATWLVMAQALERPTPQMTADPRLKPAHRPAPRPPIAARPDRLSLTNIARLIRDPYAIYARHILKLYPLDPLHAAPDPRDRGMVVHEVLERFVKTRPASETRAEARRRLLAIATIVLAEQTPFPAARTLWLARLDRAADHFLTQDGKHGGVSLAVEAVGSVALTPLPFTLYGTPDRIDRLPDGRLQMIDYKTGTPPTEAQQRAYEKQLLLAAAMAERGGFADLGPSDVAKISYIGLGAGEKAVETEMTPDLLAQEWDKLITLISRYLTRTTGYTARRAMFETTYPGDYDHLSRFGEWQMSDRAQPEIVGPEDAP